MTYVSFGIACACFVANLLSIIPLAHIVYCYVFKRNVLRINSMSASLLIFIVIHIAGAVAFVPYFLYVIIFWSYTDGNGTYDPYVLYWTGMFTVLYLAVSSTATFFLTLDRCLLLRFPGQYFSKIKKRFPYIFAIVITTMAIAFIGASLFELPLKLPQVRYCQSYGCLDSVSHYPRDQIMTCIKQSISGINIVLMFYFAWMLRHRASDKRNDHVVKVTIVVDVILDSVPLIIYRIFLIADSAAALYVAQANGPLFALHVAVCGIYYWKILLRYTNRQVQPKISSKEAAAKVTVIRNNSLY
ncbi:hypothetical protein DdX_11304 [Ditylenchus destructor]|uniref:Uncharacterized protein n=1 Tax=Ditylenchus destructor TaxID=166010 RepID=A0AAD4MZQ9_9BILA|nr:hypothetical protein DdX_11304 [Ditylenchus destructor]